MWQMICLNSKEKNYLVTVDHYPDFFEVDALSTKDNSVVIKKMKPHFEDRGVRRNIVCYSSLVLTTNLKLVTSFLSTDKDKVSVQSSGEESSLLLPQMPVRN